MNCGLRDLEENIRKYLDGEMSESEMTAFEEHFLECDDCLEELRNSAQLREFIQSEGNSLFPEFSGPEKLKEKEADVSEKSSLLEFFRFIFTPGKISFGIAAVVILFVVFIVFEPENDVVTDDVITYTGGDDPIADDTTGGSILSTDTVVEYASNEIYAENFVESENLEFLMGQNYRSGDDLVIISPSDEKKINEEVLFHWNYNSDVQLILLILDNHENVLFKFNVKADKLLFNIADNGLDPGLYYWKLESEDDLLHIGKIIYGENPSAASP